MPGQPSGLGWRPDGTMLIVSMTDRRLMRFAGGKLGVEAELGAIATGLCNDMIVDARGRAYVGNFGFDRHAGEKPRPAVLARVDPDATVAAPVLSSMAKARARMRRQRGARWEESKLA